MPDAIPRSSSAYARICYTTAGFVENVRLNHWLEELPYHKQVALGRKTHVGDKTASLMGLQLLKLGMRGVGFDDFSLADLNYRPNGKPACSAGADVSISHAGGLIACVIGVGARVGIDLEPLASGRAPHRLRHYFDKSELACARRDIAAGLRIWTAKEAILKAHGAADLTHMAKVTIRGQLGRFQDRCFHLHHPRLAAGYMASIATEQPQLRISIVAAQLT
jgi:phosphopantetheinyl transferase